MTALKDFDNNEVHGNTNVFWDIYTMTYVASTGGGPITIKGRYTDVPKRINGKWRYTVAHIPSPSRWQTSW